MQGILTEPTSFKKLEPDIRILFLRAGLENHVVKSIPDIWSPTFMCPLRSEFINQGSECNYANIGLNANNIALPKKLIVQYHFSIKSKLIMIIKTLLRSIIPLNINSSYLNR